MGAGHLERDADFGDVSATSEQLCASYFVDDWCCDTGKICLFTVVALRDTRRLDAASTPRFEAQDILSWEYIQHFRCILAGGVIAT